MSPATVDTSNTEPLRILFFTSALGGGGAEKHLQRIVNAFDRRRIQPLLALARGGGSYEQFLADDIPLYHLDTGDIDSSTLRLLRAWRPLRELLNVKRPDLLCSFMDFPNNVAIAASRFLPSAPPVVACVQNTPSMNLARSRHPVRQLVLRGMQLLYPYADGIVALSQGVRDDLLSFVPQLEEQISVIYNAGIDDALLEQSTQGLDISRPTGPLLIACGSLSEQKGYPILFEALTQVRRDFDAHLWILGEGPLRDELQQLAEDLNVRSAIKFLGFRDNPYKFMAAGDVFVLSSLWEGFGNVVVEAMACGTAVVATDCPHGPGEIIEDERSGLLVPPADPDALADAVCRVLSTPQLRQALESNAQNRARDFHADVVAQQYETFFRQLVEHRYQSPSSTKI